MNVSQGLLPFQLIEDTSKLLLTSFAGIPLVIETFRALGLSESVRKHLPVLQRPGRYCEAGGSARGSGLFRLLKSELPPPVVTSMSGCSEVATGIEVTFGFYQNVLGALLP